MQMNIFHEERSAGEGQPRGILLTTDIKTVIWALNEWPVKRIYERSLSFPPPLPTGILVVESAVAKKASTPTIPISAIKELKNVRRLRRIFRLEPADFDPSAISFGIWPSQRHPTIKRKCRRLFIGQTPFSR